MEETKLIESIIARDEAGMKILYNLYSKKVYNTAVSILQNTEDAEELTQDVFLEVFQSIQKFKRNATLSTWIYRLTINKSLDLLKSKRAKKRFAILVALFNPSNKLLFDPLHFDHPGAILESKEDTDYLFRAIESLPDKQKTAFILSKTENLSNIEISAIMDVSISSVESLLFRAKQNLRTKLQQNIK